MKNVSTAFKNELYKGNRNYIKSARIILSDSTIINIDNSDFWNNGIKVENAVSSNGSFDIGAVIIGQLTLTLNNIEEKFSDYDFTNAKIDNVKVGLKLPDNTIESLTYGVYTVNETSYNGSIITITAYDNMYKFDKTYSKSNLTYPATLNEIVRDACSVCDVTLQTVNFDNDDFVVNEKPADEAITFRNVLQWVAQISCKYCTIDEYGRLVLSWYDMNVLENIQHLDGGRFSPWTNENTVSGGTFSPWTAGNIYDSGTFEELRGYHHLYSWNTLSLTTDDVVITGVRVTEEIEGEDGKENVSYQSGTDGYVLAIEGNKLIQGTASTVAGYLGVKINGMRFRPFSGSTLSNPTIEPGDAAILTDRKGNIYNTIITTNTFQPGNFQTISCEAKSPARNSASRYSQATQAYVDARKEIQKEKTDREQAIEELTNRINNSSGTFTTIETQPDGSNIYYLHNKPQLADSDIIWKMTAEAWGVSTDGGKTWNAGVTVDGDTIVRILTAVGINADWINAGSLSFDRCNGGTLILGGANNQNGSLKILNRFSELIGKWDNEGIMIDGGVISMTGNNDTKLELEGARLKTYKNDILAGLITPNELKGHPDMVGLSFNLETTGTYMSWSKRFESSQDYESIILYSDKESENVVADTVNFYRSVSMHGNEIHDSYIYDLKVRNSLSIPNNVQCDVYSDMDFHNFTIKNIKFENIVGINGVAPYSGKFEIENYINPHNTTTVIVRNGLITYVGKS